MISPRRALHPTQQVTVPPAHIARSATSAGPVQKRRTETLVLLFLYLVVAITHILFFRTAYQFPHLCTDAVQYVTTAENIIRGHGYTIRGIFNTTCPPLYPLFLAVGFSMGPEPRATVFVLSCLAISAVIFPIYWLSRLLRMGRFVSAVLALAAGFLPHTLYCAFNMAEPLEYPLFAFAAYYGTRWFSKATLKNSIILGSLLSLLLFNKLASLVIVICFLLAAVAWVCSLAIIHRGRARRAAVAAGIVFGMVVLTQAAWIVFKSIHHGTALGKYGTELKDHGLHLLSPALVTSYVSDYFLAPGLLTLVPLVCFFVFWWKSSRWPALAFAMLFSIQLAWVSIVDGGLTGMLRERLLSYSFPILAVFATRGFIEMRRRQSRIVAGLFLALPAVLLTVLYRYDFHEASSVEFPWAYAFGALRGVHLASFASSRLWITGLIVSVLTGLALLLVPKKLSAKLYALTILGFQLVGFTASGFILAVGTPQSLAVIAPVTEWLRRQGAAYDSRVLVASQPAPWEMRPSVRDAAFPECRSSTAIDPIPIWQIEAYYRWDVRSVCGPDEIQRVGRPGDFLLTAHAVRGAAYLSSHGSYNLYRLTGNPVSSPEPRHSLLGYVDLPKPGAVLKKEAVVGGWVIADGSAITDVFVDLDRVPVAKAAIGGRRPDVERAFPDQPGALLSGFYTVVDISRLPPGTHQFSVRARTGAGEVMPLGSEIAVVVVK
jgi:hypothetical protein